MKRGLIKRGESPALCIMENPYCTCQKGRECELLPSDKSPLKDGESLTGATTDPQNPSTAGMNKPND